MLVSALLALASPAADVPFADTRMIRVQAEGSGKILTKVPVRPRKPGPKLAWTETKKKKRCISLDGIAGAVVSGPLSIDLVFKGGQRWRMRFRQACPALGFYQGFYFRQLQTSELCAGRDVVHPRSGGECEIAVLRSLVLRRVSTPVERRESTGQGGR